MTGRKTKTKPKPRVALYIEGGNLHAVLTNVPKLKVVLVDCDNLRASGFSKDGVQQLWTAAVKNLKQCVY